MNELTDQELIEELKKRFESNQKALGEQARLLKELEMVNSRLVDSENVRSQFLSNIRNEINNPLASILGLSKSVPRYFNDEKELEKVGELIFQEAFSLDFQLKNIFVAAELEAGAHLPEISNMDIQELIKQVIDEFRHVALKKNLIIIEVNEVDERIFRSDAEKLHMVLVNLLANAIEFSEEGAEVKITWKKNADKLCISIQDYGTGISIGDQDKIYDRFKQLDSGSTKGHGGHGLGLSIVKDLLEMMDGEIHLESEIGAGSTFSIELNENSGSDQINLTLGGNEFLFDDGDEVF
ncbi:MAG: HAMP domain-containing histidine kinase [Flavobacteriales bacterium]|nr:HAMP domain-containing histidine kinase [Flavobacteriales bacterium]